MRILIYGLNYAPELTGIGKYTGDMAEDLVRRGHDVTVITAPPYYPYWKIQSPYRGWAYQREIINGVNVIRCPLWVPEKPSGITRIVHLLSFPFFSWFTLLRQMMTWKPDVVFNVEPAFFTTVCVAILSPIFGMKSWLHVQDFELDAAVSLGILPEGFLMAQMFKWERWIKRRFSRVSSISKSMVDRLYLKGVDASKTVLFLNWTDAISRVSKDEIMQMRSDFSIPLEAKIILYSGNMGRKQGLDIIPMLAQKMAQTEPHAIFLLVGDGPMKAELEAKVAVSQILNIRFAPLQPREKLSTLLSMADVHLVLQRRDAADLVMPSKLGPILSVGGAVLVTSDIGKELYQLVHDRALGWVTTPESVTDIHDGIVTLLRNPEQTALFQKNAKEFADANLSKEKILSSFERELQSLMGK